MEFKKSETRELIEAVASSVMTVLFIMIFLGQSYMVKGSSMEPTLHEGERLLVEKISYRFRLPQPGEIVVFKYPREPKTKFIKRVIAVEGQSLCIQDLEVQVNGVTLAEPYIKEETEGIFEWSLVPDNALFVMGDNRNRSMDSRDTRNVGYVPLENLVGRAVAVYWPPKKIKILKTPDYQRKHSNFSGNAAARNGIPYPKLDSDY